MNSIYYDLLKKYIPNDHSHQVTSEYYIEYLFNQGYHIKNVMDLGCGSGNSLDYFRKKDPNIKWIGLDIKSSPEAQSRKRTDGEFYVFDGIHIPFDDNHFELIYCNQVFEHVRYPIKLLEEICRVIRPDGYFVGSTSQLEPYHSYSLWNYTPYGFRLLIEESGLQLVEIRPGIDAITLIIRRGLNCPGFFSRWWTKESPLNMIIGLWGKAMRKSPALVNTVKLLFCGQFCFLVRRSNTTEQEDDRSGNRHT